jgi:hypothetical protein
MPALTPHVHFLPPFVCVREGDICTIPGIMFFLSTWQAKHVASSAHNTKVWASTTTHNHQLDEQTRAKREARRGARTHNLEIKSLTRYRLCQPGLKKQLLLLL